MKKLEGEVVETLLALTPADQRQESLAYRGETVDPSQFLGLEINPRAVAIADLVLWIGYLKWQIRSQGVAAIQDPVLRQTGAIRQQDAILAWDSRELRRDKAGVPVSTWDGHTMKPHPVTGMLVPDETARIEAYTYVGARRAEWPEAEFVVGNPPFIGGKDLRAALGDGYAEAAWKARPEVPGGADFVMHFWDEAARRLTAAESATRRFGFITTNSITQAFSRRVIERFLRAERPLSLVFAVPDHPWLKAADKAAVRMAMTVARGGAGTGLLAAVAHEAGLDTDTPEVRLDEQFGPLSARLAIGADVAAAVALLSNEAISSRGVSLHGAGFIVSAEKAAALGLGRVEGLERYIVDYRNGRDLAGKPRMVKVIDLFGLDEDDVRQRLPAVYQHLLEDVKPHRFAGIGRNADADEYAETWWLFGKVRTEFRSFTLNLRRYVATVETTKHRVFHMLDTAIRPDNMLVCIGLDNAAAMAVLSARPTTAWTLAAGGWLGVGNDSRYSKTRTFDPYPFPALLTDAGAASDPRVIHLRELGERLDAFRKERLVAAPELTMTKLYNALERFREAMNGGVPLTDAERIAHDRGLVALLAELHDDMDRSVLAAYGWSDLAQNLVGRPGGTTPSPHKSEAQEAAEEELLVRLVALNAERAAEERRGLVRWLRPDYQIPKLGHKVRTAEQTEADLVPVAAVASVTWPERSPDQLRLVRDLLAQSAAPITARALSQALGKRAAQKRDREVEERLESLVAIGAAHSGEAPDGSRRYFATR